MNKIVMSLGVCLLSFFIINNINAQCGAVPVTATPYCPDQYAEYSITDPSLTNTYRWYDDASGTNDLGYGPLGVDGKYFSSPTEYPTGSGDVSYWYQKEIYDLSGGAESSSWNQSFFDGTSPNSSEYEMAF